MVDVKKHVLKSQNEVFLGQIQENAKFPSNNMKIDKKIEKREIPIE